MVEIDLDAVRAARAEASGEGHVLTLLGVRLTLPAKCPLAYLDLFLEAELAETEGDQERLGMEATRAAKRLLGPEQWRALLNAGADGDDLAVLVEGIAKAYGFAVGESPASPDSSRPTGDRARPTSNGSTASTSRKRSSGQTAKPPAGSSP